MHKEKSIINAVNEILDSGTKIVSFKYKGEQIKNVLIGSDVAGRIAMNAVQAIGDKPVNHAMTKDGKVIRLYGISNNEDHTILDWEVRHIEGFSYLFGRHEVKTLWEKIKAFFSRPINKMLQEIG